MSLNELVFSAIAATITITLHEFIKALISSSLGDPLPKRDGRVTLNPLKHIEPIGFIIMIALGFGWGKPVETASIYYKDRKKGTLITYIIPSVANLLFGIIAALLLVVGKIPLNGRILLHSIAICNLRHAFFNIVPVYPLDGAKVFATLRNPNRVIMMVNNQTFHQMILVFFIIWGLVSRIIDPVCYAVINGILNLYLPAGV